MFAVGAEGLVRRRTAGTWTSLPNVGDDVLLGVWAAAPNDIIVVGRKKLVSEGVIHRFNGSVWTSQLEPSMPAVPKLSAVWGAGAEEIYVVGEEGTLFTYTGGVWMRSMMPTARLVDVSGSGRDAIAAGADGSFWRISP